jgi:hypothetical protein
MLVLIAVLLFCVLLAMLPKDQASGIVKGVAVCFAVLAIGTVLFYAWGFYLYESDKAQAVAQAHTVPIEQTTTNEVPVPAGSCTVGNPQGDACTPALPECSDPYEPYRSNIPTCEWHESKH